MKDINDLRVAMVLNKYQIVLNAGISDGVKVGSSYIVYEDGPEVIDPVTGNSLGTLELVKGRVWVHQVAENHSVAGHDRDHAKTLAYANNRMNALAVFAGETALESVKVNDRAKRVS